MVFVSYIVFKQNMKTSWPLIKIWQPVSWELF